MRYSFVGNGNYLAGDRLSMAKDIADKDKQQDMRKTRLAEELRANLQKRKAQSRSRRTGNADSRPEGIAASETNSND